MTFNKCADDVDGVGLYTWTGKVWLPTYTQMNGNTNNNISEGTKFDKYSDDNSRIKTIHPNCKLYNPYAKSSSDITSNGAWNYWLSSISLNTSSYVYIMTTNGNMAIDGTYMEAYYSSGLAPCICLPKTGGIWA